MKIIPYEKFDLYQHGNFINSFDSYEDIEKFLQNKLEEETLFYSIKNSDRKYLAEMFNNKKYSIIKSTYLKFSV